MGLHNQWSMVIVIVLILALQIQAVCLLDTGKLLLPVTGHKSSLTMVAILLRVDLVFMVLLMLNKIQELKYGQI